MHKKFLRRLQGAKPGMLLVEALMGILLFGLFATATFLTLLTGQESSRTGSARIRGVYYAEQGLEVAKAVRDDAFANLSVGTKGFDLSETGRWVFSGSTISRYDFTTQIKITASGSNFRRVTAQTKWKQGYFRSGATVISMLLGDWRTPRGTRNWASPTQAGSFTAGKQVNFNDIVIYGNYAYVSSLDSGSYGDGLYILDISNPASPTRVSSAFSTTYDTYGLAAYDNKLIMAINDVSGGDELQAFDIEDPTSLGIGTPAIATYDLPGGNGRGRILKKAGSILVASATSHAGQHELYFFNIQNLSGSGFVLLGSLNLTGDPNVEDIYLEDSIAYVATSATSELQMVDFSDPANPFLSSTFDAGSTAVNGVNKTGTGYFFVKDTSGEDEYILVSATGSGLPDTNPTRKYGYGVTANVNAMARDGIGCYQFLASSDSTKELMIMNARNTTMTQLATDNTTTGAGRAIEYDLYNDRLYMATESGVYVYTPNSATGCLL